MKLPILSFVTSLLISGCLGDAVVIAKFSVKNKTSAPIQVKSKKSSYFKSMGGDTTILINPKEEKIIYSTTLICPAGNCRGKIAKNKIIDSVSYSFKDKHERVYKLNPASWKIKRHGAIVKVSK